MSIAGKAALCAAVLLCAGEANAATIVQTASSGNGPAYVNRFNTELGTLTSVNVESSYFANFYLAYGGIDPTGPVVSVTGSLGDRIYGLANVSGEYPSSRFDSRTIFLRLAGTATSTVVGNDLRVFTDMFAAVPLFGMIDATFRVGDQEIFPGNVSFPGSIGGTFKVTYNYEPTAFVPEPSTWALMLAGFGLVGYAMRRRTRVAFA